MANRKHLRKAVRKAKAAQNDYDSALAHCNDILVARGEAPVGPDNFMGPPIKLKKRNPPRA